jgi:hypothetical protein
MLPWEAPRRAHGTATERDRDERRRGRGADHIVSVGPEHVKGGPIRARARHLHRDGLSRGDLTGLPETLLRGRRLVYRRAGVQRRLAAAAARWRTGLTQKAAAARRGAALWRDTGMPPEACNLASHRRGRVRRHGLRRGLVHGYDIALGLGIAFARRRTWPRVRDRLFRGPRR